LVVEVVWLRWLVLEVGWEKEEAVVEIRLGGEEPW
jgi:hypothetical protein